MDKEPKLNGRSIKEIRKLIDRKGISRSEIAIEVGVKLSELTAFIKKFVNTGNSKTKLASGFYLVEKATKFSVQYYYNDGSRTKIKSIGIDKGLSERQIKKSIMVAESELEKFRAERKYNDIVGRIIPGEEYSIKWLMFYCGNLLHDANRTDILTAVRANGSTFYTGSSKDYAGFCVRWHEAIDVLVKARRLKATPVEWLTPPTEEYHDSLRERLIREKIERQNVAT